MAIAQDLNTLKTKEQGLTQNKVSRFAYTQNAYDNDTVTGVSDYVPSRDMNVPLGTAEIMKVNPTIPDKGWRAQASALTRMLMNHFLGRISYNLNKIHDNFLSFLTSLQGSLGTANGIATLDENGRIPYSQLPESAIEYKGTWNADTNTPTLADGTGTLGDMYIVSVAGTQNLGSGTISFDVGDRVLYDGSVWQKLSSGGGGDVASVNNVLPDPVTKNVEVKADDIDTHNLSILNLSEDMVWTQGTGRTDGSFRQIKFANNLWVACSNNGIFWSEDGKSWTIAIQNSVYCLLYANGIWVAGGSGSVYWSMDGKNWTEGTASAGSSFPRGWFPCVYHIYDSSTNGIWCLGNASSPQGSRQGTMFSLDGKVWTNVPQLINITGSVYALTFSEAFNSWLACSSSGIYFSPGRSSVGWNAGNLTPLPSTTIRFNSVACSDVICVAGSDSNGLWWSEDGNNWTQVATATTLTFTKVYYADNVWIALSTNNIYKSLDGKNWEVLYIEGGHLACSDVFFSEGLWVFGSIKFGFYWSQDLQTWFRSNEAQTETIQALFSTGDFWVAGSDSDDLYWAVVPKTKNVEKILAYLLSKVG